MGLSLLPGTFGASPWFLRMVSSSDSDIHFHLRQSFGKAIEGFEYRSDPQTLWGAFFLGYVWLWYLRGISLNDDEDYDNGNETESSKC